MGRDRCRVSSNRAPASAVDRPRNENTNRPFDDSGVTRFARMTRHAFVTVTDHSFFPGTLATVNSILEFHPASEIHVVVNHKHPLTRPQADCLRRSDRVRLVDSREFDGPGRHINAWELK